MRPENEDSPIEKLLPKVLQKGIPEKITNFKAVIFLCSKIRAPSVEMLTLNRFSQAYDK
jgi:hypothetical protein